MTHWNYGTTPFGNIVYTIGAPQPDGNVSIYAHGAGELSAAEALHENFQDDVVPHFDALKAEARRQAEAAGAPHPAWYAPNPQLTVNGKGYHNALTAIRYGEDQPQHRSYYAGKVVVMLDGLTDAARRKLSEWFQENWDVLASPDVVAQHELDRAKSTARHALSTLHEASKALAVARVDAAVALKALKALDVDTYRAVLDEARKQEAGR